MAQLQKSSRGERAVPFALDGWSLQTFSARSILGKE